MEISLYTAASWCEVYKFEKVDLMNIHVPTKKTNRNTMLPIIKCSCGARILLVPNVKLMSTAIEAHVEEHKRKIKDPDKSEAEAERIRDDLIAKILDKASES